MVGGNPAEAEAMRERGAYARIDALLAEARDRRCDRLKRPVYTGTNGIHPQYDNDHDAMSFAIGYLRALHTSADTCNWRALVGDLLEKIDDGRGLS